MAKLIRCECGFVARGETDDQVVDLIGGHMASDHPALVGAVSFHRFSGVSKKDVT